MNIFLALLLLVATIIFLVKNKKTESILMFVGQLIIFLTIITYQILNVLSFYGNIFYSINHWINIIGSIIFIAGVFVLAFNTKIKIDKAEEDYNKRVQNNKKNEGDSFITKKDNF